MLLAASLSCLSQGDRRGLWTQVQRQSRALRLMENRIFHFQRGYRRSLLHMFPEERPPVSNIRRATLPCHYKADMMDPRKKCRLGAPDLMVSHCRMLRGMQQH